MSGLFAFLLAFLLAAGGFAALALSMHRHHRDLFARPPSAARTLSLRAAGWMLLALSLATCFAEPGWAVGTVLWLGLGTAAAATVALSLTWLPRSRR